MSATRPVVWLKVVDQTVGLRQPNPATFTLELAPGHAVPDGLTEVPPVSSLRFQNSRNPPATNASEYVGKTYRVTAFGGSADYDLRWVAGTLTVVAV